MPALAKNDTYKLRCQARNRVGMTEQLSLKEIEFGAKAISPMRELGAYEALWDEPGATFKRIAERFAQHLGAVPSDFVEPGKADCYAAEVTQRLLAAQIDGFGVRVHGAGEYPHKLRDAAYPIELLYFKGWWDLVNSRSVAVVGTRNPTQEGKARARRLAKALVNDDITVVSGLAAGIDTVAHETAIEVGGRTIAVIGTPLSHVYPRSNRELQTRIAEDFLVISQVPVIRYDKRDYRSNRAFFPERNATMSALTEATIIVEAGETSGTLTQARAALHQGRKLFILDSCFENNQLTWPHRFAELGAIRVKDYDDIARALPDQAH